MNMQVFEYSVLPSIVRANELSAVTIHPLGENVVFIPGETYGVDILGVETHCTDHRQFPKVHYDIIPNENGDLVFTHCFGGEQKHVITVTRPEHDRYSPYRAINNNRVKAAGNSVSTLYIYSLYEDLYGLRAYKGEVHCHTFESDGTQDACHTVGNYRSAGYDFLAITDHYQAHASQKVMRVFDGAPVDMTLMLGEEVHTPNERIHAVHLGGTESINEYYRCNPEEAEAQIEAIRKGLPAIEGVNDYNYAWHIWISQKAREFGGLSILAHPHWVWFNVYFTATATTKQLLRDGVYDALDLRDTEIDTSVALWADMRAEGLRIPVVGSTDSHVTNAFDAAYPWRGGYTLVFAPDRSAQSIMDAIRDNRSLCVTTVSTEMAYGPSRLVKFARFLFDNFYPVYMRMCRAQGELMSEYPVNGAPNEENVHLLEALNRRSQNFARAFYGY